MKGSPQKQTGQADEQEFQFKIKKSILERIELVSKKKQDYPGLILSVCEPHPTFIKQDPDNAYLKTSIVLVAPDKEISEFRDQLRRHLPKPLVADTTFYIFCNNVLVTGQGCTMRSIFEHYKDPVDGILYIKYARQETFG